MNVNSATLLTALIIFEETELQKLTLMVWFCSEDVLDESYKKRGNDKKKLLYEGFGKQRTINANALYFKEHFSEELLEILHSSIDVNL